MSEMIWKKKELESEVEDHEKRIAVYAQDIQSNDMDISQLKLNRELDKPQIDHSKVNIVGLQSDIQTVEMESNENKNQINDIKNNIHTINNGTRTLKSDNGTNKENIAELQTDNNGNKNNME
jgi:chromosome segregation ATPase